MYQKYKRVSNTGLKIMYIHHGVNLLFIKFITVWQLLYPFTQTSRSNQMLQHPWVSERKTCEKINKWISRGLSTGVWFFLVEMESQNFLTLYLKICWKKRQQEEPNPSDILKKWWWSLLRVVLLTSSKMTLIGMTSREIRALFDY